MRVFMHKMQLSQPRCDAMLLDRTSDSKHTARILQATTNARSASLGKYVCTYECKFNVVMNEKKDGITPPRAFASNLAK